MSFSEKLYSQFVRISFCLFSVLICSTNASAQANPATCGVTAPADILIVLDLTASSSAADIAKEKTATIGLLDAFNDPAVITKPHIGVATFNHDCTFTLGVLNCVGDAARMVPGGNMTNAYGALGGAPDLYDAVNGITGPGFFGAGKGGTNIQAGLQVAQNALDTQGDPARPDFIIIISDGDANLPGYDGGVTCGDCICLLAEDAADTFTQSVEPATQIFAVHYQGTGSTACADEGGFVSGLVYMRDRIASNPANFYSGQDLTGIFNTIAQDISCNDNNACTTDVCNQTGPAPVCQNTPDNTDSDGDGVPNCQDACPGGADNQIGQPCSSGVGACLANGTFKCNVNKLECDAVPTGPKDEVCDSIDNDCDGQVDEGLSCGGPTDCKGTPGGSAKIDRCGVCDGDGSTCCTPEDIKADQLALDNTAFDQKNFVLSALKRFKKVAPNTAANRQYIEDVRKEAVKLYTSSWQTIWSLPTTFETCTNAPGCQSVDQTATIEQVLARSKELQQLGLEVVGEIQAQVGKRPREKGLRKQINSAYTASVKTAGTIPETRSFCSA